MSPKFKYGVFVALAALVGSPAAAYATTSRSLTASTKVAASAQKITVGFAIYAYGTPYADGIIVGAQAAAHDLGATLKVAGTPVVDYPSLDTVIRNQSGAGAQGLVAPGPTAVARVLLQIGKPFATFDQCDITLKMLCVDQDGVASGKILGKALLQLLGGPTVSGTVLMGICVAGLPVMVNRLAGVKDALAVDPNLHILPVFTTSGEPSQNEPIWRAEVAAHPTARALVGSCSTDTTSIGAVNAAHGDKYIAVGYDVTAETLAVVKNGSVKITVGQGSYLQGYWTTEAVIDSIRTGKPVPTGWIDPGTELITKANVATFIGFSSSAASEHSHYLPQIHENLARLIKPSSAQSS